MIVCEGKHGGKLHRCDGRCHWSTSKRCRCICGGALHGIAARHRLRSALQLSTWFLETVQARAPRGVRIVWRPPEQLLKELALDERRLYRRAAGAAAADPEDLASLWRTLDESVFRSRKENGKES